eukprot:1224516-Alexandrium_andersonii.AAC.1
MDDPFAGQAAGLPSSRTLVKLDDERMNGVSRTDEVDKEFRELSATLAPQSVDGFAWLETI